MSLIAGEGRLGGNILIFQTEAQPSQLMTLWRSKSVARTRREVVLYFDTHNM